MSDRLTAGTVTPAYGRDYKSSPLARADFEAGKDFILQTHGGSGYVGKADFAPGSRIVIRFGAMRKTCVHIVGQAPMPPRPRKPRAVRSTDDTRAERSAQLQAMADRIDALPEPPRTSYAVLVMADDSGKPAGNALRFATRAEAEAYARDLASRWFLVRSWTVLESPDAVNYTWTAEGLRNV